MKELNIWKTRYDALVKGIDKTLETLEKLKPPQLTSDASEQSERLYLHPSADAQKENIDLALTSLKNWSKLQFDFFFNGFEEGTLVKTKKHVPEFALRRTLDQTGYDLLTLQRAIYQRVAGKASEGELDSLSRADKFAMWALKPAIDADLIYKDTKVLT